MEQMGPEDLRALTPLIYNHVYPLRHVQPRHEREAAPRRDGDRTETATFLEASRPAATLPLVSRMLGEGPEAEPA
jgi:hypothetical protein